jgi:hypothetical protein
MAYGGNQRRHIGENQKRRNINGVKSGENRKAVAKIMARGSVVMAINQRRGVKKIKPVSWHGVS